jgi:hypothetical protein
MADQGMKAYEVREDQEPVREKHWINPLSGMLYEWDDVIARYVPTGEYPYGINPLDF